ncbi:MAG: ThiF family adenylyltransferase [Lutibacter sp.]
MTDFSENIKISPTEYFKRQTTLLEIGEEGQKKLLQSKVIVIGCGGLGSPLSIYLATSGVGNIHLVDFDKVSISNLHRQVFYTLSDVNKFKSEVLAAAIKKRTPFTNVTYSTKAISKDTILNLISNYDVVVDTTDSLPIKYLINDACVLVAKPLIYGSLYKFDGYVATFNVKDNMGNYSCNLRDAFPKISTDIPNCEEAGTLNGIVGVIALLQANEVIKFITKTGNLLTNQLLIYNSLKNSQLKIKLVKNNKLNFNELFLNNNYSQIYCESQKKELLISNVELQKIINNSEIKIISVIEDRSYNIPFKNYTKTPYSRFSITDFKPDYNKKYIVVCKKGITSYDITLKLLGSFPKLKVFSLKGGIENC